VTPTLPLRSFAVTDVGRVRKNNEDAVIVDTSRRFYAIADGIGGHEGGEHASNIAVRALTKWMLDSQAARADVATATRNLRCAFAYAHVAVQENVARLPKLSGMGTTLVALQALRSNVAVIASAGDSRAYMVRAGILSRITADHAAPDGKLTSAIGVGESPKIDVFERPIESGDTFLLCSDGLHGIVPDAQILSVIKAADSVVAAGGGLVRAALEAGGPDNVSVIVVQAG
jgi:protein phosphatase